MFACNCSCSDECFCSARLSPFAENLLSPFAGENWARLQPEPGHSHYQRVYGWATPRWIAIYMIKISGVSCSWAHPMQLLAIIVQCEKLRCYGSCRAADIGRGYTHEPRPHSTSRRSANTNNGFWRGRESKGKAIANEEVRTGKPRQISMHRVIGCDFWRFGRAGWVLAQTSGQRNANGCTFPMGVSGSLILAWPRSLPIRSACEQQRNWSTMINEQWSVINELELIISGRSHAKLLRFIIIRIQRLLNCALTSATFDFDGLHQPLPLNCFVLIYEWRWNGDACKTKPKALFVESQKWFIYNEAA